MDCERCGGLMMAERGFEVVRSRRHADVGARRCLNCGNLVDAIILANRAIAGTLSPGQYEGANGRHPRMIQPIRMDRILPDLAARAEGVIADGPRDHAPRPPGGVPSAMTQSFETGPSALHNPIGESLRRCA